MNVGRISNYVIVLAIGLMAYYFLKLDVSFEPLSSLNASVALLLLFGGLVFECLIVLLLVRALYPLRGLRFLAYLVVFIYVAINLIQIISFEVSTDFVTKLALGNVEFVGLLVTVENVVIVSLAFLAVAILPWFISGLLPAGPVVRQGFVKGAYPLRQTLAFATFVVLVGVLFNNTRHWVPEAVLEVHSNILRANALDRLKPIDQFFRLFKKTQASELFPELSQADVIELNKYGFVLRKDKRFPLLKDKIYHSPPPFSRKQSSRPNIILIFTEGLSARTSGVYSADNEGLTPNLDDFAAQSMVVKNYYNHTAATYRGLHGGLCSLYPKYGALGGWLDSFEDIPKTNYKCLTDVFRNNGYRQYYLDPHFAETSGLDEMMRQLKFDEVMNADQMLPAFLDNEKSINEEWLSDHQMYRSLVGFLKQQQAMAPQGRTEPFFLTMYSVETHAWVDVSEDGVRYQNGKHKVLNTIHNMDDAFAYFWDYYQRSQYAQNTVIVFTSDHTHFYSNPFLKLMKAVSATDYQRLFIGKIPMIIHDPLAKLPAVYDADYASSIDLAPTLVHLLGLPNEKHSFMGTSMFDRDVKVYKNRGIAAYDESVYLVDKDQIHTEIQHDHYASELDLMSRYIRYVQGLEIQNRIYP